MVGFDDTNLFIYFFIRMASLVYKLRSWEMAGAVNVEPGFFISIHSPFSFLLPFHALPSFIFLCFFEMGVSCSLRSLGLLGTQYIAKAVGKFLVLFQPPKSWDYYHIPSQLAGLPFLEHLLYARHCINSHRFRPKRLILTSSPYRVGN